MSKPIKVLVVVAIIVVVVFVKKKFGPKIRGKKFNPTSCWYKKYLGQKGKKK